MNKHSNAELKTEELMVEGMHCNACEVLIEKKIRKSGEGVVKANASLADGKVSIQYRDDAPSVQELNSLFHKDGYTFHKLAAAQTADDGVIKINSKTLQRYAKAALVALVIFVVISLLENILAANGYQSTGIESLLTPGAGLTAGALLIVAFTGVIAGLSSCAALVGGLLLSMSKQWNSLYTKEESMIKRGAPYFMFNIGRLIAFPLFGGLLGLVGNVFHLTLEFNALLVITIGVVMFALGMQMLGVKQFSHFSLRLPKRFGGYIADESNFQGKLFPFIVGGLTFFLPCGFTLIAQSVALVSRSFTSGALIMLAFAVGTLPMLTFISWVSVAANKDVHIGDFFNKVAGFLVAVFAISNINNQLAILGTPSLKTIDSPLSLLKFSLFLLLCVTLVTMAWKSLRSALDKKNLTAKRILFLLAAVAYGILFISILLGFQLLLPWEYTFTPVN